MSLCRGRNHFQNCYQGFHHLVPQISLLSISGGNFITVLHNTVIVFDFIFTVTIIITHLNINIFLTIMVDFVFTLARTEAPVCPQE